MPRTDVMQMPFAKRCPLLVNKAEKKGRTRQEVDQVTAWLTGCAAADVLCIKTVYPPCCACTLQTQHGGV